MSKAEQAGSPFKLVACAALKTASVLTMLCLWYQLAPHLEGQIKSDSVLCH